MANNPSFTPIGSFGLEVAHDDNHVTLRIPLDRSKGRASASGKMVLTGSTPGFVAVPGTDLRVNVSAGFSARP